MASETLMQQLSISGIDPSELDEWFDSLEDVLNRYGPERLRELLVVLQEHAYLRGVTMPFTANTPYINTIPVEQQPRFPGNIEIERRIKSIIRWNAMAMVVRANRDHHGIGGHISTFASSATLYEIGFNHFFRGRSKDQLGDMVYFQGHASPGMYARAFLEGRLTEEQLVNFRREIPRGSGALVVPASLVDARLLAISHGLDGIGSDHGHLSREILEIHAGSRIARHRPNTRLVFCRRR